jgi:hypothetical protein
MSKAQRTYVPLPPSMSVTNPEYRRLEEKMLDHQREVIELLCGQDLNPALLAYDRDQLSTALAHARAVLSGIYLLIAHRPSGLES